LFTWKLSFSKNKRLFRGEAKTKKGGVCGRKISKEEYEAYDGLCWECWDDRMTEEIDTTEETDEEFVPM